MGWFTGGLKFGGDVFTLGVRHWGKDALHEIGNALDIDDDVEKFLDDLTKGVEDISGKTAAEEEAKAAAEAYTKMSETVRAQARVMGEEAEQSATNLVNDSNSSMSNALNLAAALGGVGFNVNAVPAVGATGIDVGTEESQGTRELKARSGELTSQITDLTKQKDTASADYDSAVEALQAEADKIKGVQEAYRAAQEAYRNGYETASEEAALKEAENALSAVIEPYNKAKDAVTEAKGRMDKAENSLTPLVAESEDVTTKIGEITKFSESVGDVELPDQAKFSEGSMSANLATMRDRFQQARNTYVRGVQTDIGMMMSDSENYDEQAVLARRAGEKAGWQSLFGAGGTILGGAIGAYFGGPAGAAMGMQFGRQAGGYAGNYYSGRM